MFGLRLDPIKLSKEDYDNIIEHKKNIGSGEDGTVYYMGNGICYKFYHQNNTVNYNIQNRQLDDQGVNIAKVSYDKVPTYNTLKYIDSNGVRLIREKALYRATERKSKVELTQLPLNLIYVDGHFRGCAVRYYRTPYSIYAAANLPRALKVKVCRNLLIKYRELIRNNIYPVDLCQRDKYKPSKRVNSNVLLGYNLEPIIIDLDGKSALYTEQENGAYLKYADTNLATTVLEILTHIDLTSDMSDNDIDELYEELVNAGFYEPLIKKYINTYRLDDQEVESCINDYARIKHGLK